MSNLVTTGKPKIAGAVYRAKITDSLTYPTDATEALSDAFVHQGYVTEDGVSLTNNISREVIKAWGGDVVLNTLNDKGYKWDFSLMEHLNPEVHKTVYGEDNVKIEQNHIEIDADGETAGASAWVIERVTKEGKADRVIIFEADITEIGETSFKDNEAIVYPIGLSPVLHKVGDKYIYFREFIEK